MPNRRHLPVLPVLLSAAFLTACAPTMVPVTHLPVPTELLSCTAEPVPPVTGVTDTGLADGSWISGMRVPTVGAS